MKRPSALKKTVRAKPAARAAAVQSDDEPGRKSRVGFNDVKQLADALSPFIDKRFFTSYTTDRAHKPLKRLPSDVPSGRRKVKGKQPDGAAKVVATVPEPAEQDDLKGEEQQKSDGSDTGQSNDSTSSSSSSSSSGSSISQNDSQQANEQEVCSEDASKPQEEHPQQQSSSPQADEEAASFMANDWFLNTLEGMMGGDLGYLSPTPGPPRRRAADKPEAPEASALKRLKPLSEQTPEEQNTTDAAEKPDHAEKTDHAKNKPDDAEKPDHAEKTNHAEKTDADTTDKKEADKTEKNQKDADKAEEKNKKDPDKAEEKNEKADGSEKPKATGDIKWNPELGKACWQKKEGVIISSIPFVDKNDEVKVSFGGLLWSVPHLVPRDLDPSMPANPSRKEAKAKAVPKAKPQPKPVDDYVYPIIRCKYCTQGSKNPLIKIEAREDRGNLHSKWVQKLQVVIKSDLTVQKAMNVAKSFADAYVYMNLNPGQLNFRGCRDSLLAHKHDWETSALDWQTVNKLGLKHFPRPNDSPIKMQKTAQTQIAEDGPKPAKGDDADECDDDEGEEAPVAADPGSTAAPPPAAAAPPPAAVAPNMTSESKAKAIANYASHYHRDPKDVTIEVIQASAEGATYWVTVGSWAEKVESPRLCGATP
ncbi:unnamed protein product [Symbiodinium sp. CCMP2592]|nr:unnamed protein product [Symbiodinium sp. CCMP2592]